MKLREVVRELRRELDTRDRLYPKWVEEGRLSQAIANERRAALAWSITILSRIDDNLDCDVVRDSL